MERDRQTFLLAFMYFSLIGFFLFLILGFMLNFLFFIGTIVCSFTAFFSVKYITISDWNEGICKKYNEPWEFESYKGIADSGLGDKNATYTFKCRDKSVILSKKMMEDFLNQYKGERKIEGI